MTEDKIENEGYDECWMCGEMFGDDEPYVQVSLMNTGGDDKKQVYGKYCITCSLNIVPGINKENLDVSSGVDWREYI